MDGIFGHLFLSRFQFGLTTSFHILFAALSVGLSLFLVAVEGLWLKTGDSDYYRHARYWGNFFLVVFAVGVVSGIPLSFQFGTNWEPFSVATAGFFGNLLGFEALLAFMLESAFLGVMLLGWNRVSRRVHFFSTIMVAFAASLSAYWIMVANSWMQTPAGGVFENGKFVVTSYKDALLNPDWFLGFFHMWGACVETVLFIIGGISAWMILTGRHTAFFQKSFKIAVIAAIVFAPLQFLVGDTSGRLIALHQPAKLAAIESHWETNKPGEDAGWNAIAWPDRENERNIFQIRIPYGLSLLITHSFYGQVTGLKDIPPEERPPIVIPFYSFRIMMAIGFAMIFLALWTIWLLYKGRLTPDKIGEEKKVLFLWVCTIPLGYIAIVTGWMTREIGRQPWVIYGLMKTRDGATTLPAGTVAWSILVYTVIYTVLFFLFLGVSRKVIGRGPDMDSPVPPGGGKHS